MPTTIPSSSAAGLSPASDGVAPSRQGKAPPQAWEVLTDLHQEPLAPPAPGVLWTLLLTFLTAGIGPAIVWQLRFKRYADAERRSLRRLAAWARVRTHPEDAAKLAETVKRVGFRPWLLTLALTGIVMSAIGVFYGVVHVPPEHPGPPWLVGITFGFAWPRLEYLDHTSIRWTAFNLWFGGLFIAYLAHLDQVHRHARSVRCFLDALNRVLIEEGTSPVYMEPIGLGFSLPWVLLSVLLILCSSPWGIPLAVAGATDRRYRRRASCRMREALAGRVKDIVLLHPEHDPRRPLPASKQPPAQCPTPGCGRVVAAGAKFCPRCGTRWNRRVDRQA